MRRDHAPTEPLWDRLSLVERTPEAAQCRLELAEDGMRLARHLLDPRVAELGGECRSRVEDRPGAARREQLGAVLGEQARELAVLTRCRELLERLGMSVAVAEPGGGAAPHVALLGPVERPALQDELAQERVQRDRFVAGAHRQPAAQEPGQRG